MLMEDVLKHPANVLTAQQRDRFFEDGCLVVECLVGEDWLARLHQATQPRVEASCRIDRIPAK